MEADLEGQTIIFPLGPSISLSWANCDGNQTKAHVYRCARLRPGYRFN